MHRAVVLLRGRCVGCSRRGRGPGSNNTAPACWGLVSAVGAAAVAVMKAVAAVLVYVAYCGASSGSGDESGGSSVGCVPYSLQSSGVIKQLVLGQTTAQQDGGTWWIRGVGPQSQAAVLV